MTAAIMGWLRSAHGRCLEQVMGEFYLGPQMVADESPMVIWVQFAGSGCVRIFGKPDGWGIDLDERPPIAVDMGSAGRTVIRDIAKMGPFSDCMESALKRAALLTSYDSPEPVGIRLNFESGGVILILNWGDELVVDSRLPRDASPGEIVVHPVYDE